MRLALVLSLGFVASSACRDGGMGSGMEVSLGAAGARLDLSRCMAADCSKAEVERPPIGLPARPCEAGDPIPLTPLWIERFNRCRPGATGTCSLNSGLEPIECEAIGTCIVKNFDIAVAPDGSLWATGAAAPPSREIPAETEAGTGGVWLAHHAPDGHRLSGMMIDSEIPAAPAVVHYDAELEVDGRGHAFVVLTKWSGAGENDWFEDAAEITSATALLEYAPDGQQVGTAIVIEGGHAPPEGGGVARPWLWKAGESRIALGQPQFGGGGIGVLNTESRAVDWVQTRTGRLGFMSMASDYLGRISMLTKSPNGELSGRLEHYDGQGRLAWERTWRTASPTYTSLVEFATDPSGDMVVVDLDINEREFEVLRISAEGEPLWSTRFSARLPASRYFSSSVLPRPAIGSGGELFMPGAISHGTAPAAGSIHELSPDGGYCRSYAWTVEVPVITQLAVSEAGDLYFATPGGYGRFEPLDRSRQ